MRLLKDDASVFIGKNEPSKLFLNRSREVGNPFADELAAVAFKGHKEYESQQKNELYLCNMVSGSWSCFTSYILSITGWIQTDAEIKHS